MMSPGDNFRAKALELLDRAETQDNRELREELENLAAAFLRLAKQAKRDAAFAAETEVRSESTATPKRR
jgi:NTP pyrophosphatase (non-canonical NTP hydrolase)